jgi:hypothetical protein
MKTNFERNAGICLIIFILLMTFTMVMHPAGGGVAHLQKIRNTIIITHAIAIFSLPFAFIGFWGLTRMTGTDNFFSAAAFSFVSFGLVAVLIAAAANGLIMPLFLDKYRDAAPDVIASLKPVLSYSFSMNAAFDYIYSAAFCMAILGWSIAIILSKKLPIWIAWLGIVIAVIGAAMFFSGFAITGLQGFRIFVSTIIIWIAAAGFALINTVSSQD